MLAGARLRIRSAIRKRVWLLLFSIPLLLAHGFDPSLFYQSVKEGGVYFTAGMACQTAAVGSRIASGFCRMTGWSQIANEFALVGHLFDLGARRAFRQLCRPSFFSQDGSHSFDSWRFNQKQLSEIPVSSHETRQLVQFLEQRWLAKANGFYPSMIDWVFPCFDIRIQVHPQTAPTYARDPGTARSNIYINRVEAWKKSLAQARDFPLILTRPYDFQDYLPFYHSYDGKDEVFTKIPKGSKAYLDITSIFPQDPKRWDSIWKTFQSEISKKCKKTGLDPSQIVCLHRIKEGDVGGLRLLAEGRIDRHHEFLLEWISRLGFTATQVELDRWPRDEKNLVREAFTALGSVIQSPSKETFIANLAAFETDWRTGSPEKKLMLQGALQVLKGLFASLPQENWNRAIRCPTRSGIIKLSFSNINEQLEFLAKEGEALTIFDFITHVEQIHSNLVHLIEILSPFKRGDFAPIYRSHLPKNLSPLVSCSVHATAMASVAGIYKAVEKMMGRPPRILYGENAYFENIITSNWVSKTYSMDKIQEEDWSQIDLILAQFNPALRRVDLDPITYKVEKIEDVLRKTLKARQGNPVTLALDCTIDFIHSQKAEALLQAFQKEIEEGTLNVIGYRSGLKYDLFGMDHFAGAPFYMIHNRDPKWSAFDSLIADPALETDRLSYNWFCLAYKYAPGQLELYRKTIFDNTRALLDKIPPKLYDEKSRYRVVEIEPDADPGFLDARIFGPHHRQRGASIVIGSLFSQTLEAGHPIFTRRSIGFYHPNVSILFGNYCSTLRLTLGLDPAQVDVFAKYFEEIAALEN